MIIREIMLLASLMLLCSWWQCVAITDTITRSKSIAYPDVIISSNGRFQLGFFSPADSTNLFLGIWYKDTHPAKGLIWVANREFPLREKSGTVMISEDGNLVVLNELMKVVWSSDVTIPGSTKTKAQLWDTGNLVLVDEATGTQISWESFQHPSNVLLQNMEISISRTGLTLSSWKSLSDPSVGNFSAGFFADADQSNVEFYMWNNSKPYWRSGPWNGQTFVGISGRLNWLTIGNGRGGLNLTREYSDVDFLLDPQGRLLERELGEHKQDPNTNIIAPIWDCDFFGKCGPFGICVNDQGESLNLTAYNRQSLCSCLSGFKPRNTEEWSRGNWTSGCVRSTPLHCYWVKDNGGDRPKTSDGFRRMEMVKVPASAMLMKYHSKDMCRLWCQINCSCVAYTHDSALGCMVWSETLIDLQSVSTDGVDLFIRLAQSEFPGNKKKARVTMITLAAILGTITISVFALLFFARKQMIKRLARKDSSEEMPLFDRGKEVELQDIGLFKFEKLATATNSFDLANQIGQGGFGAVYMGTWENGQKIAVKRLSSASSQGLEEFMNEVLIISKLQHQNLVRLLGCCVEREEKILVYEYMPKKSLDALLFDPVEKECLDWRTRFNIIEGISRGLLYLHRDSRLRIIHRDLKAANILLDEKLNPKISDFGMAKIFGGDDDQVNNTRRVVGTYGYMSPEYAMRGRFSEKSDVFSFGVILLEIVSGRRNTSFHNDEKHLSLVGYAWKLWNEGDILDMIDEAVSDPCYRVEAVRCIHVGLLCVQEFAEDRPTMSKVITMLNSEIVDLPSPTTPAFTDSARSSRKEDGGFSINEVTITNLHGR